MSLIDNSRAPEFSIILSTKYTFVIVHFFIICVSMIEESSLSLSPLSLSRLPLLSLLPLYFLSTKYTFIIVQFFIICILMIEDEYKLNTNHGSMYCCTAYKYSQRSINQRSINWLIVHTVVLHISIHNDRSINDQSIDWSFNWAQQNNITQAP